MVFRKKEENKDLAKRSPATERGEIRRRDPLSLWSDMDSLFDRFRRSFDDLFWLPQEGMAVGGTGLTRRPLMDVEDTGKEYQFSMEAPGLDKDDVNIEVTSTSLEVSAESSEEKEEKGKNFLRRERGSTRFFRSVELPEEVETDGVEATMENGVLNILLPKKEPKETERKTVKVK